MTSICYIFILCFNIFFKMSVAFELSVGGTCGSSSAFMTAEKAYRSCVGVTQAPAPAG